MGFCLMRWFWGLLFVGIFWSVRVSAQPDMRILVDVSGSMKQSDPANLRVPALRLLGDLMPSGSRVGIWLFDGEAHELMPSRTMDKASAGQLRALAARIHSKGAFTNIEGALRTAIKGWNGAAEDRSIMLLTDGKVDLSSKPEDAVQSRERILKELVPLLQQLKARVYSVALSDQADAPLLRQLSEATGGWFEVAHDAAALQKRFLTVYRQAVPHESVPIINNDFRIDARVQEFSVVVFLRPGARPTRIKPPGGRAWGQQDAPATAHWRHESGYDLVTVHLPEAGTWKLEADMDPDNQVIVVTDLGLEYQPLPAYLHQGDGLALVSWLTDGGKLISDPRLLGILDMSVSMSAVEHPEAAVNHVLQPDKAANGRFAATVALPEHPGRYVVSFRADGGSVQRQQEQTVERLPDWVSWVVAPAGDGHQGLTVRLTPHPEAMDVSDWLLEAMVADQGASGFSPVPVRTEGVERLVDVAPPQGGAVQLALRVSGRSLLGETFSAVLPPIPLSAADLPGASSLPEAASPSMQAESGHALPSEAVSAQAIHEQAAEALIRWPAPEELRMNLLVLAIVNVVAAALFFFWRARQRKASKNMLAEMQRKLGA